MEILYDVETTITRCPDCNAQVLRAKQRGGDRVDLLEPGVTPVLLHERAIGVPHMVRTYHHCPKANDPNLLQPTLEPWDGAELRGRVEDYPYEATLSEADGGWYWDAQLGLGPRHKACGFVPSRAEATERVEAAVWAMLVLAQLEAVGRPLSEARAGVEHLYLRIPSR